MGGKLEVVVSPALLPYHEVEGSTVVVIDILRATTSICTALHYGAERILVVSTPEEALSYKDFGFVCAAEREALKVPGFDLGNSPAEFQNPSLLGKSIAFTTTNGTRAIQLSLEAGASRILIGSFLNLTVLCEYLKTIDGDLILLSSGWKNRFNLEDTLFAGAVVERVKKNFTLDCDAAVAAEVLFKDAEDKLNSVVRETSHAKRFPSSDGEADLNFCLQIDTVSGIPVLSGEYLTLMQAPVRG